VKQHDSEPSLNSFECQIATNRAPKTMRINDFVQSSNVRPSKVLAAAVGLVCWNAGEQAIQGDF